MIALSGRLARSNQQLNLFDNINLNSLIKFKNLQVNQDEHWQINVVHLWLNFKWYLWLLNLCVYGRMVMSVCL